jgi:3-oxoacyl-[acyl-carrier protein] reductase
MSLRLSNKLAVVTGGSRGIGKSIAIALAKQGADVIVNYRSRESEANDVVSEMKALGRKAVALPADVSSKTEVQQLVKEIRSSFSTPISVLVNNAGIAPRHKFEEIGEAEWDNVLSVNLRSAFLVTQAFLPEMRAQRWGRIIFVSSVAAKTGGIVGPHYTASKAGMLGLMHYFAKNFAGEGITSNAVAPALIETEMAQGLEAGAANIPVGRLGTPEEVADACILLAVNGFMNGQTVHVDGGVYLT